MVVNLAKARAHLSALIKAALAGEVVVIARRGVPLVRLHPVRDRRARARFGVLRGKVELSADFDEPLDAFRPYRR